MARRAAAAAAARGSRWPRGLQCSSCQVQCSRTAADHGAWQDEPSNHRRTPAKTFTADCVFRRGYG
eukprot:4159739-Pyramimonas_sp.AAC.1